MNTSSDMVDFGGPQQVGDLPGPDGVISLREAIIAANNTGGPQVIGFNIPASDPGFAAGVFTIKPLVGEFSLSNGGTTIDGLTQTVFTGNTNPAGPEIVIDGSSINCGPFTCNGFVIPTPGNTLKDLVINHFTSHGITMFGNGSGNTIMGCYIGTDPTGSVAAGSSNAGITSPGGNTIGGLGPGEGNVIAGFGIGIGLNSSDIVRGNKIGTNAAGTAAVPNSLGIVVNGSGSVIEGNLISGNLSSGIQLVNGATDGNLVRGNKIGTDVSGTLPLGNGGHGIDVCCGAGNNTVGGAGPGDPNTIAFNGMAGVVIRGIPFASIGATGNRVSRNSIFDNFGLGIDLGADGLTPNDGGDVDTDPDANNLQNFPVVASAVTNGVATTVQGTLDTPSPETATVELFSNTTLDASGFGEGKTYLGSAIPDAAGNWSIVLPMADDEWITATATDAQGNTSEFSAGVQVVSAVTQVQIEIKPEDALNEISPNTTATINVAVLSDATVSITTIDPASVRFGATGTEASSTKTNVQDIDGDGDLDLLLRFKTQHTGIVCGATQAFLTGMTFSGQVIAGFDWIKTVGCTKP